METIVRRKETRGGKIEEDQGRRIGTLSSIALKGAERY
jgi:hypothetical protein